jgi:hypothetical protein
MALSELRRRELVSAVPRKSSLIPDLALHPLALLSTCKGNLARLHEELTAERRDVRGGPISTLGAEAVVSGADGYLPPARDRANADYASAAL